MKYVAFSFARVACGYEGLVQELCEPKHGWPNVTVWVLRPEIEQMPILGTSTGKSMKLSLPMEALVKADIYGKGYLSQLCEVRDFGKLDTGIYRFLNTREFALRRLRELLPYMPASSGRFSRVVFEMLLLSAEGALKKYGHEAAVLLGTA